MYRTRTHPHEKHMGSYQIFAWRDALALAGLVYEVCAVPDVEAYFVNMSMEDRFGFEAASSEIIEELIRRSEGQRLSYLKTVTRTVPHETQSAMQGLYVLFAIIGQVRVKDLIDVRDRFRYSLAPGSGNRLTCAGLFAFEQEIRGLYSVEWPLEVFEVYREDEGYMEDE